MTDIGPNKRCSGCGEWKCVREFTKNRARKDGLSHKCKSCWSDHYIANKSKINAYKSANKEKIATQQSSYYAKNKEKLNAQSRAYYHANKDKLSPKYATYRAENKEKIAKFNAGYREKNKEKLAAYNAAFRAKRRFALEKLREMGMVI